MFDSFWRAVAYCMHPRLIAWSLLPLAVAAVAVLGLGWAYWEAAVAGVRDTLAQWQIWASLMEWLDSVGGQKLHALLAPMLIVLLTVPLIVVGALVLVALFTTPAVVALVARRRFPDLERRDGAAWWQQLMWTLSCTAAALIALVLSLPLWFIPPLVMILPPLIWGWLACKVLAFDVLAAHADRDERRLLLRRHRWPLLAMGVTSGFIGAAPSLLWVFGVVSVVLFPVLAVATVWIYTLVFMFSACWFAHYLLTALALRRLDERRTEPSMAAAPAPLLPSSPPDSLNNP